VQFAPPLTSGPVARRRSLVSRQALILGLVVRRVGCWPTARRQQPGY